MASLAELAEHGPPEVDSEEINDPVDDRMLIDLMDAMSLLEKSHKAFNFFSDDILCKTITKRERDAMVRMAEKINEFLLETRKFYGD